jgi:hypothetical protein
MKKLIITIFAMTLVLVFSAVAFGQRTQRITFGKGRTSSMVTGTLTGYKSHRTFLIRVLNGQTLKTENAGNNYITISIEAPPGSTYEQDMAADCHDRNEVSPTAAGDYRITVTECLKADRWRGTFKFRVTVR